jgi:hypothetical protein
MQLAGFPSCVPAALEAIRHLPRPFLVTPAVWCDHFPHLPLSDSQMVAEDCGPSHQMETMIIRYFLNQPIGPTSPYHIATLEEGTSDNRIA